MEGLAGQTSIEKRIIAKIADICSPGKTGASSKLLQQAQVVIIITLPIHSACLLESLRRGQVYFECPCHRSYLKLQSTMLGSLRTYYTHIGFHALLMTLRKKPSSILHDIEKFLQAAYDYRLLFASLCWDEALSLVTRY